MLATSWEPPPGLHSARTCTIFATLDANGRLIGDRLSDPCLKIAAAITQECLGKRHSFNSISAISSKVQVHAVDAGIRRSDRWPWSRAQLLPLYQAPIDLFLYCESLISGCDLRRMDVRDARQAYFPSISERRLTLIEILRHFRFHRGPTIPSISLGCVNEHHQHPSVGTVGYAPGGEMALRNCGMGSQLQTLAQLGHSVISHKQLLALFRIT